MKPPREMTLSEVEFLVSTHRWPSDVERHKANAAVIELIHIIDFIEERIHSYVPLACSCDYCGEIRNKKPRAVTPAKIKDQPIHFSLD